MVSTFCYCSVRCEPTHNSPSPQLDHDDRRLASQGQSQADLLREFAEVPLHEHLNSMATRQCGRRWVRPHRASQWFCSSTRCRHTTEAERFEVHTTTGETCCEHVDSLVICEAASCQHSGVEVYFLHARRTPRRRWTRASTCTLPSAIAWPAVHARLLLSAPSTVERRADRKSVV